MAIYRQVQMSFWTDTKVIDDFTPEDRYFYLYLLTNPHTNLCGCYELSLKQASDETGYNRESVEKIIKRMQYDHQVIAYDKKTKELLLVNWSKYNWTGSEKFKKPLLTEIKSIKNDSFREFLMTRYEGESDTVSIPYQYGSDTTVTVSVTDTVSDTVTDPVNKRGVRGGRKKPPKHKHGEYQHILLSDDELQKLVDKIGDKKTAQCITYLDEYKERKGYKCNSDYLTILKWVVDAVEEEEKKQKTVSADTESRINWIDEWRETG